MTTRSLTLLIALPVAALAGLTGCVVNQQELHIPLLEEIAEDADAHLTLIDRAAALEGALNYDLADDGAAIEMGGVSSGFLMDFSSDDIQSMEDVENSTDSDADAPPPSIPTYNNIWTATSLAVLADIGATAVVGPPAVAVHLTTQGTITQHAPNVWVATNTLAAEDGSSVSGTFVAAWVGVGWLAEMRISSSDGVYNNTLWFNGFLSNDGNLGWWDLYSGGSQVAGVVEWINDGQGNAQAGIAAVAGPDVGDILSYWEADSGHYGIAFHDAGINEDAWVTVNPDVSGELRAYNYNGGEPACWDTSSADAVCPQ